MDYAQMEADRRERAAKDPITQGSIAQKLPGAQDDFICSLFEIGCVACV